MELKIERIQLAEELNLIYGMSHFIKTVEDIYEAIVNTVPGAKFGIAFNEASGPRLVRKDGTDEELIKLAAENQMRLGAGHTFLIVMRDMFPINIIPALRDVREIVNIFCATSNPVQVILAETEQGRGVLGVIDGSGPYGIETPKDATWRTDFLKKIGYKR
ncbi:MAG: adenosine-specific kinase [Candidatus Cloacimonetes bacterium]|nr:adenosine-specific kinase [Candidatus Cloacimonadota bacterium]